MRKMSLMMAFVWANAAIAQTPEPVERRIDAALAAIPPRVHVTGRADRSRALADLMREHRVPAVSIAIVRDGRIVWARAYGMADPAAGRAATAETLFQAASISKPVAATAALRLVEEGQLQLDRPVNALLRTWQLPDSAAAAGEPVTLRRLLSHTAGVTVHGFPGYAAGAPLPGIAQILDGVAPANTDPIRVDARPGAAWRYSGGGFTVAQLMMTDATGQPFPELMDRLVLRPLGMAQSSYQAPAPDRLAVGHAGDGTAIPGRYYLYPEMAAAGLWTTPSDLARWAIALSDAYDGRTGGVLRPETARAMLTAGLGGYGLGVAVTGEGEALRFSHSGANEGYRALIVAYPQRREAMVVMTNGVNGDLMLSPITWSIGRTLGWPDSEQRTIVPAKIPAAEREAVIGRYGEGDLVVTVAMAGEALTFAVADRRPVELIAQGGDVFISVESGTRVAFARDPATQRVASVAVSGLNLPRLP